MPTVTDRPARRGVAAGAITLAVAVLAAATSVLTVTALQGAHQATGVLALAAAAIAGGVILARQRVNMLTTVLASGAAVLGALIVVVGVIGRVLAAIV